MQATPERQLSAKGLGGSLANSGTLIISLFARSRGPFHGSDQRGPVWSKTLPLVWCHALVGGGVAKVMCYVLPALIG